MLVSSQHKTTNHDRDVKIRGGDAVTGPVDAILESEAAAKYKVTLI